MKTDVASSQLTDDRSPRPEAAAVPPPHRFTLMELSGSLGDLGTFLPLAVAMAVTCGLDLGVILICAGVMNVLTGFVFRQPMPVQPMKVIAVVAIAQQLTVGDVAAAGLITGVALVVLAATGGVDWACRWIPKPVVRGVQLGVGIKLILTGLEWIFTVDVSPSGVDIVQHMPWLGWNSIVVGIVVAAVFLLPIARRGPGLLFIFAAGFAVIYLVDRQAYSQIGLSWPRFAMVIPSPEQWRIGLVQGAIPQIPLTLLNSVIAVCALSADYFPGRGAQPRKVAVSVGLMNLLAVPWGGMPMCHGAGGLAAQYRFGARTGGSVIMLGGLKIIAGLLLGGSLVVLLDVYPRSILCVMLGLAGLMLASAARDTARGWPLVIVLVTAVPILMFNTLIGFATGIIGVLIVSAVRRYLPHSDMR